MSLFYFMELCSGFQYYICHSFHAYNLLPFSLSRIFTEHIIGNVILQP